MRQVMRFVILAGTGSLAACATNAPATLPALAPGATTPVVAPANSADASASKLPHGYTRVLVNGEERFCRNDLVTGSRTEHQRVCLTAEQLKASQTDSQDFMNQVQGHGAASTFLTTPGATGGMGR